MSNLAKNLDKQRKIEQEFTDNITKTEAMAQAVAPFIEAAKEAMEDGNKVGSATEIGVNYQKYNDLLIDFAAKVNKVTAEMTVANIDAVIPNASDICKYLDESLIHYTSARDHWQKKIKKQDTTKTEKMLQLEWVAARAAIELANDLLRLSALGQGQENKLVEDGNLPGVRQRLNKDRQTHEGMLASSNQGLEEMLKYGYSDSEVARMNAYLEEVVWKAKEWTKAKEKMVVDPIGEPVERKFQRRREAIMAPLDALKEVLTVTQKETQKKRQKASADLDAAKVRANQSPGESDLLRKAEDAYKSTIAQQNEAIEIIQNRIQDELKALNQ